MYDFESENPYMKKIKELWGRDIEAEEALSNKILALYIEGKSLLKKGQYIKAEEKLNYALSLEPIDKNIEASILLTLGDIYLEQKRYFESEKKYKEAILKEPWDKNIKAQILINYANLYFRQKKIKEAKKKINEAISINPNDSKILSPQLIEEGYTGFNIVRFQGRYFGIAQNLGPLDLTKVSEEELKEYEHKGFLIIGNTAAEVKYILDNKKTE